MTMKKLIFFLAIFLQAGLVFSQAKTTTDTLVVAPGAKGLYFYHVVEKGETLYSLSRTFSIDPHQLANANGLTLKTPLKLYQLVKIPLNEQNMSQSAQLSSSSTPLFHKVIKGETLYRVGKIYDNVPVDLLKKWNHLQSNEIATGQYLIIGWLRNNKGKEWAKRSPEKTNEQKPVTNTVISEKPVNEVTGSTAKVPDISKQSDNDIKTSVGTSVSNRAGSNFLREVIAAERSRKTKTTTKPIAQVTTAPDAVSPMRGGKTGEITHSTTTTKTPVFTKNDKKNNNDKRNMIEEVAVAEKNKPKQKETPEKDNLFSKMLDKVTKKPEKTKTKTVTTQPKDTPENSTVIAAAPSPEMANPQNNNNIIKPTDSASGLTLAAKSLFEQQYLSQTKNETAVSSKKGAAGWFKSNVKPGSERYYALCNDLPRGTIVKVINPINHQFVFVKVLAGIPKQKENYNLIIKLSDAAMEDLGTSQPRFWCKIVYSGKSVVSNQ